MFTKNGEKEYCKAYRVRATLSDSIGREAFPSGPDLFPHVTNPKEVFAKIREKKLDLVFIFLPAHYSLKMINEVEIVV